MAEDEKNPSRQGALIGQRVRELRRARNWTQPHLANLISKELGLKQPLSVQAISKWERGGKQDFSLSEIDALARVFGRNRDFFVTVDNGKGVFHGLGNSVIVTKPLQQLLPLVAFEEIGWGTMRSLASRTTGEMYATNFPIPHGGLAYRPVDDSMEPLLKKGASVAAIGLDIEPEPGDLVLVEFASLKMLRQFFYDGADIVLMPYNPKWRTYRFAQDAWEHDVRVLGVMTSFETQGRVLKSTK